MRAYWLVNNLWRTAVTLLLIFLVLRLGSLEREVEDTRADLVATLDAMLTQQEQSLERDAAIRTMAKLIFLFHPRGTKMGASAAVTSPGEERGRARDTDPGGGGDRAAGAGLGASAGEGAHGGGGQDQRQAREPDGQAEHSGAEGAETPVQAGRSHSRRGSGAHGLWPSAPDPETGDSGGGRSAAGAQALASYYPRGFIIPGRLGRADALSLWRVLPWPADLPISVPAGPFDPDGTDPAPIPVPVLPGEDPLRSLREPVRV